MQFSEYDPNQPQLNPDPPAKPIDAMIARLCSLQLNQNTIYDEGPTDTMLLPDNSTN
jgi:hypothetical protein